jgi:hypothetical protein
MNAQTNFQQFVSDNKGKLITFLHTDKNITRFVVDVCGEYFTGKINESDAKIDGFYYFSDCKMVPNKNPLEEIFETHKFTVVLTTGCDIMAEYIEYDNGDFVVKDLRSGHFIRLVQPSFYIKEVWAIVDGKYTKVWESAKETVPQTDVDTSSDLYHLLKNNKTVDIHTKTSVWKDFELNFINGGIIAGYCKGTPTGILVNSVIGITVGGVYQAFVNGKKISSEEHVKLPSEERFNNFKRVYPEILKLDSFLKNIVQEPQFSEYKKTLLTTYENKFNSELWNKFCTSWESLKGAFIKKMPTIRYDPTIQALVKRFSVITHEINPSTDNTEFIGKINRFMSPQGKKIYEKLINTQPQTPQAPQAPQSSQRGVSIEYRGKAKTVEVINEYIHSNGKNYVLVKDLSDNDKTKTLFKEYIKYL